MSAYFSEARKKFHTAVITDIIRWRNSNIPSFADKHSKLSCEISRKIIDKILGESEISGVEISGQTSGKVFEDIVLDFVQSCFYQLNHLRPGSWQIETVGKRQKRFISKFEQYSDLLILDEAARSNPELAAALGSDYTITPDIVMFRLPEADRSLNQNSNLLDNDSVTYASLREKNNQSPILHASISCKWTIRSDRSQNSRTEALNLIRNRKGRSPHIVVVTAEPLPS